MTSADLSEAQPSLFCGSPRTWQWWGQELSVGCGRRDCEVCGERWARDQRIKLLDALAQVDGDVALVTVTAPGQSVLPWASDGTHTVEKEAADGWNRTAAERWREMHRRAQQVAARLAAKRGASWRLWARVWELQRRGVLHLHLVVPFATETDRLAARAYVAELEALRGSWGFGFVDRGVLSGGSSRVQTRRLRASSAERAAAYVGGYLTSGEKGGGIRAVAREGMRTGSIVYVSHRLTSVSGTTMRSLRGRRSLLGRFPWCVEARSDWDCAAALAGTCRGQPPPSPAAVAQFRRAWAQGRPAAICDLETGLVRPPLDASPPQPVRASGTAPAPLTSDRWAVRLDSVWHRDHRDAPLRAESAITRLRIRPAPV